MRLDRKKKYAYDALNRLCIVTMDSIAQKNHYDGESLRYEVEENDKVIRFVFDRGELSAEENAGQKIRYIHGNDNVVCSERQKADTDYHICDEAGSTLFILDRTQNIRKTYRYDAFGKLLEERGDIENRLTYTGQMYDGATGQYYLRARFYNPVIGRFLQEDGYRGDGLNLYAYCANNPIKYYDPSGYMGLCLGGKTNASNAAEKARYKEYWIEKYAQEYADVVNTNKPWSWDDIAGGDCLTAGDRRAIKAKAIAMGLIPDVKMKPGTKYPDFGAAGQIIDIEHLPEHLWLAKDRVQFQYLDDLIGGRPEGTTWNHSEIPGQMELVPFGIHNIINHLGGAIPGHWAYRPGGR